MSKKLTESEVAEVNQYIAERVFGWRWVAYWGVPVRSAPDYPEKRMVRLFVPPKTKLEGFEQGRDATGDEPLSYRYDSSQGPQPVPNYVRALRAFDLIDSEYKL